MATTYTFKSVTGGMPKFKSSGAFHIPASKPSMDELADSVIFQSERHQYVIYPATDTVIIDTTTYNPGDLTPSQLCDHLNVLFPKAGASASTTGGNSLTLTSPDGSVWTITISNEGVLSQSKP